MEGYTARRLKAYRGYLETGWGKTEVRLMAVSLAQVRHFCFHDRVASVERRETILDGLGQSFWARNALDSLCMLESPLGIIA